MRLALLTPLMFFAGCGEPASEADADGDGLSDAEEATLGTDPSAADSDGDGLSDPQEVDAGTNALSADSDADRLADGEEASAGTNALSADSDGDGYGDADELAEGSDPTDPASVIYTGGWPYYWDKGSLPEGSWTAAGAQIDGEVPDLVGVDQFGEEVHLHDFAMQGVPIVIDTSAGWCGPCKSMAEWLSNGENSGFDEVAEIRTMLENGELYWVTVLYEDASGNEATSANTANWDRLFPNEHVAVVTDPGGRFVNHIAPMYIPNLSIIREDMTWGQVDPEGSYFEVMQQVIDGDY